VIIGLSGKKGSGKNQVAEYMAKILGEENVNIIAFADPIKEIAVRYMGVKRDVAWGTQEQKESTYTQWKWEDIPREKRSNYNVSTYHMTVRQLLQYIGTELFRQNISDDFWVKACFNQIYNHADKYKYHIITDVRFPNEAIQIKDFGGKVVRLWRGGVSAHDKHMSETALNNEDRKIINSLPDYSYLSKLNFFDVSNYKNNSIFDIVINNYGDLNHLMSTCVKVCKKMRIG
tara:strand:+ start:1991 stop:2683 length:693 start_codon:yes stop_codon:yes gene_type:complete